MKIRKKGALLLMGMLFLWSILLYGQYVLQKEETSWIAYEDGITRGEVLKAIALALTDKETCEAVKNQYFLEEDVAQQTAWYVPYANYLYEKGVIETETIVPMGYAFEQNIETSELKDILYRLNLIEVADRFLQAEDRQVVLEKLWWDIYDEILAFYDRGYEVTKEKMKICGTIANLSDIEPWKVYTNQGIKGFDGLALDYYIDSEIEVLQRNGEIIRVITLINRDITYENVWIMENGEEEIQVFLYGMIRSFSMSMELQKKKQKWNGTVGDLSLKNGTVVEVTQKTEAIQTKVLAVQENSIELEQYGVIPLAEEFQVYQLYGKMQMKGIEDIMVGYDTQQFILQDGKICTALLLNPVEMTQIRVLLMTTGYTSYYHPTVQCIAQNDLILTEGNEIRWYPAGSVIEITPEMFHENNHNHMTLKSEGEIGIASITRTQGIPYYSGTLELTLTEQGILIVNELSLENYLLKVVPSEMPARYGVEAAKIQAICARSFAIGQIEKNACRAYGAHVDDSTTYQVYNNISPQQTSTEGVKQTEGLVLTDLQTGNMISAWYYSTSCGFGTDNRSWGSATVSSYIQAREISEEGIVEASQSDAIAESVIWMQQESVFRQWITNWDVKTYESYMTWFRWKYRLTKEQLQSELQQTLPFVMESYSKYVLTVDELGNERRAESSDFGTLVSIEIKSRGVGGIVQELYICGTKQNLVIKYQTAIRMLLGNAQRTYENLSSTGMSVAGTKLLPSAFFCIDSSETEYTIYGGGIGHGIGMSQNAAKEMCDNGMTAEEVLHFFYPGAIIKNAYYEKR